MFTFFGIFQVDSLTQAHRYVSGHILWPWRLNRRNRKISRYSDLALRVLAVAVGCIQQPPLDIENEDLLLVAGSLWAFGSCKTWLMPLDAL